MDQAFAVLREHARTRNLRLSELARAFVEGKDPLAGAVQPRPGQRPRG
jgi:hypothetical protein